MSDKRTKLCFEPAVEVARDCLRKLVEEVPELRGAVIVFDWRVGKEEFPPGIIHSRDNSPNALLTMVQSVTRMLQVMFRRLDALAESVKAQDKPDERTKD